MDTLAKVFEALKSIEGYSNLTKVRVTIGDESWSGVRYTTTSAYTDDMDAVIRGQHKAGDLFTREFIYVVGQVPKCFGKLPRGESPYVSGPKHVCFPFESFEWYVAGYIQNLKSLGAHVQRTALNEHIYFTLSPWDLPDSKIDDGERPYTRIPMTVTAL